MVGPADLLSAARLLAGFDTAAARFLRDGKTGSSAYSAIYCGFSHGRMKAVCEALNVVTLGRSFARQFRRTSVSPDIRAFAPAFLELQEARHLADYDPQATFTAKDAETFIGDAEGAISAFDRAEAAERDDVLALMLTSARG